MSSVNQQVGWAFAHQKNWRRLQHIDYTGTTSGMYLNPVNSWMEFVHFSSSSS